MNFRSALIFVLALASLACVEPPRSFTAPLDDGQWRVELSGHTSERLVSLRPQHLVWQLYMEARGDFHGFSLGQIKDAVTVRSSGRECADWRHIRRTHESAIPGVTDGDTYISCLPPQSFRVYVQAPLADQVRAAQGLGFICRSIGSDRASCAMEILGRAVESTLGDLAHPRPSNLGIDFRAEFDVELQANALPTVTCRSWEESSPNNAFTIINDDVPLRISAPDTPTSRWRSPVQDCDYRGVLQ